MFVSIQRLLRQPLLHFILLGVVLFLVYAYLPGKVAPAPGDKTIIINRASLLDFMQYRSQAFNRDYFAAQLDTLSPQERQKLVNDLVREEVLYKEAVALRLNENDYVIKRRLIQKLEFLTQGFITAGADPTAAEINAYFNAHKHDYYVQPFVTFTHVFFDYERHGHDQARQSAEQTLRELNLQQTSFANAIQYGDRFLYHANYVERAPDYVAAHFGAATADVIFGLKPDDKSWYGPYESAYGLHLILLTRKEPGRIPELTEIIEQVRDDVKQALVRNQTEAAINDIIKGYHVNVVLE